MNLLDIPAEINNQQKFIKEKIKEGYHLIFRPYKKDKNGKIRYARNYGHKAWPMLVKY